MKWGYGVEIGTYAQHVYSSLDERLTVLEQLEYSSDSDTTRQDLTCDGRRVYCFATTTSRRKSRF